MSRTFKIQISEDELLTLIDYHSSELKHVIKEFGNAPKDRAERIVELTRRLNKETPEIVKDEPKSNIKDEW